MKTFKTICAIVIAFSGFSYSALAADIFAQVGQIASSSYDGNSKCVSVEVFVPASVTSGSVEVTVRANGNEYSYTPVSVSSGTKVQGGKFEGWTLVQLSKNIPGPATDAKVVSAKLKN